MAMSCSLVGCVYTGAPRNTSRLPDTAQTVSPKKIFVRNGRVVNAASLRQGGKVLVVPFTAGAGVEADVFLDKTVLMMVKGIADTFKESALRFEILDNANAQDADFIVNGHVVEMQSASRPIRWILKRGEISVGVEGRMIDAKTHETVLVFSHRLNTRSGEKNQKQPGYAIGQDIGRFILSASES